MTIRPRIDPASLAARKRRARRQLYGRMKPHVRRGRVAKEKRIERAKARKALRQSKAA